MQLGDQDPHSESRAGQWIVFAEPKSLVDFEVFATNSQGCRLLAMCHQHSVSLDQDGRIAHLVVESSRAQDS